MTEYDSIAKDYARINSSRPLYTFAAYPSFFQAIGDPRGKSVLDLACGEGIVSREMRRSGASSLVGIDLSSEMIRLARDRENKEPLGISYREGRVGELGKLGEFDIVVAAFLLHYSTSKDELLRMCRDIADNMNEGGRFVTINNNPLHPTCEGVQYDNRIESDDPLIEGSELRVSFEIGETSVAFKNYFWKKETYEWALTTAGLSFEWLPVRPTNEGIEQLGHDYWKNFIDQPFFAILRCKRLI